MNDEERDSLLIGMKTDIKWIKDYIAAQNKYKLMIWGALIAAIISLLK
jgi:hypothetical protein